MSSGLCAVQWPGNYLREHILLFYYKLNQNLDLYSFWSFGGATISSFITEWVNSMVFHVLSIKIGLLNKYSTKKAANERWMSTFAQNSESKGDVRHILIERLNTNFKYLGAIICDQGSGREVLSRAAQTI